MNFVARLLGATALLLHAHAFAQVADARTVQKAFDVAPNAGAFADLRLACPDGKAALSGGLDTNGFDDMEITTLAPTFAGVLLFEQPDGPRTAADGWQARVINHGAQARRVMLSVVCAAAVDIIVSIGSVAVSSVPEHPSGVALALVSCFDGYVAMGGGVDVADPSAMKITASAPLYESATFMSALQSGASRAALGWMAQVSNQSATAQGTVKGAAICARMSGVTTQVSAAVTVPAATQLSASVACPAGSVAVGGGAMSDSVADMIVTVSTPMKAGGARAVIQSDGEFAAPTGWFADLFNRAASGVHNLYIAAICVPVAESTAGSTVNVYEFYNSTLKHFFRTSSATEANAIDGGSAGPGWQRTGDNFVAFTPGFGAVGNDVCRFYTFGANSHFYTAFAEECDALKAPSSGWVYESLSFRIQLPAGDQCPVGTVSVHRVYNNRFAFADSNHRFTTQLADVAPLQAQGWLYEGVAFCALNYSAE